MMTYNEMKEIAERYGIGITCQKRNCGGFMDEAGGSVKKGILDDLQRSFGFLEGGQHQYFEIDAVIDLYAA